MKRRWGVLVGAAALAVVAGCGRKEGGAVAGGGQAGPAGDAGPFTVAHVQFEQNATDGDVEVVFEAKGGAEGLTKLTVTAPDGRTVVDFAARDTSTMGMRSFRFESPEPTNAASLKAAYPEGAYSFAGVTTAGARLEGSATLHHRLPGAASFVRPSAGEGNVALDHLVLSWTPVPDVAGYVVYIEQEELNASVNARLPASVNSFVVPDGFLAPETQYTMGIGAVTEDGNATYVEAFFTTAAKP